MIFIHVLPVELTKKRILEIRKKIEQRNSVFAEKRYLDSMIVLSKIIRIEKLQRLTKSNPFGRKYGLFSRF